MNDKTIIVGASVIGVVGLIVFFQLRKDSIAIGEKAVDIVQTVGTAINPLNNQNVFAGTINKVGEIGGGQGWTLGGWFYDATHSAPMTPAP
jgi:hypothetical protein